MNTLKKICAGIVVFFTGTGYCFADKVINNNPTVQPISAKYTRLAITPSATDPSISAWNAPSDVYYDPALKDNKILLWLPGTGGKAPSVTTTKGPVAFFNVALTQGYRVIALSYITEPAVAQTCAPRVIAGNPNCAAQFRQKRIYGDNAFSGIPDQPQDAIVHRLTMLLTYLIQSDPNGHWSAYLYDGKITWDKFAVSGQSQGGGMAEYLGQRQTVARVISFSGGWDYSAPGKIATWYFGPKNTPANRWYATYHQKENVAETLAQSYKALGIPIEHTYELNQPLLSSMTIDGKNPYHSEGMRNPIYQPIWLTMLGDGRSGGL
jgi:hypothetical protein